jgi:hypothetical protein
MLLSEEHFSGGTVLGLPLTNTPFQSPPALLPGARGLFALQPLKQGLGLEVRLAQQEFFQLGPDLGQGVGSSPPGMGRAALAGERLPVAVLACGLAVHASLHRR